MSQSLACLQYHLIFSTKNRAAMIIPDLRERLHEYMGGILKNKGGRLLAAGGTWDHVHLLATLRPKPAMADILRDLKANSSAWVHKTFPKMQAFRWQDGYGAFTVSAIEQRPARQSSPASNPSAALSGLKGIHREETVGRGWAVDRGLTHPGD